ncbi:hypothetical protein UCRNP2_2412 [Neofusicoccum parvum UCRNP2]|uniref:Uncharacterized protein n=1 Tax=Botryosphaeria parva (strain UCR-NP2) TaxID=1287680 RepID=R1ET95_BOTPV|nr:hypothetical protein UCRNP2_2412 [Neofusicoccum parvum UCRNP2]
MRSIQTLMALLAIGAITNCAPITSSGSAVSLSSATNLLPRDADPTLSTRKEVGELAAELGLEDSKLDGTDDPAHQQKSQHGRNSRRSETEPERHRSGHDSANDGGVHQHRGGDNGDRYSKRREDEERHREEESGDVRHGGVEDGGEHRHRGGRENARREAKKGAASGNEGIGFDAA